MPSDISIKLVAPITDWKDYFLNNLWHVKISPDEKNGLTKTSTVDTLQIRGMDTQRFLEKLGTVDEATMDEILLAIVTIIEIPSFKV